MIARLEHADDAAAQCGAEIAVLEMDIDDSGTRDTGPTFVVDRAGRVAGCDWRFNGWGWTGRQESHARDALLLNKNRNPALDRAAMEDALRDWLGVKRIVWLPYGAAGDETDGHVDNVARLANKFCPILTSISPMAAS